MSVISNPFTCDACGKRRDSDTNRWWVAWLWHYPNNQELANLAVVPWLHEEAIIPGRRHACGVNCLMKLCERFAITGQLEVLKPLPIGVVKH